MGDLPDMQALKELSYLASFHVDEPAEPYEQALVGFNFVRILLRDESALNAYALFEKPFELESMQ
jgi:hypothetical protein